MKVSALPVGRMSGYRIKEISSQRDMLTSPVAFARYLSG
jgi:hypothetical protein